MTPLEQKQAKLFALFTGAVMGSLSEAFAEMAKELRRYAGSDFDKRLDALEAKAILSVENAPLDGIPESDQLFAVESTRGVVRAVFANARNPG